MTGYETGWSYRMRPYIKRNTQWKDFGNLCVNKK